jgi:hypothetical protein
MIKYHEEIVQGSDEWLALRCGLLTASEMKLCVTPTLKVADNEKTRAHAYELLAQRITKYVEPHYVSDDMLRGQEDEVRARIEYTEKYAPVKEMGFITNDKFGFTIGFSPDGLVGDDGLIECKSRRQKFQIETIIDGKMPDDYLLQVQTGLLVSERKWCDFISYSGGLPMATYRVMADLQVQEVIIRGATAFENKLKEMYDLYHLRLSGEGRFIETERVVEEEMV